MVPSNIKLLRQIKARAARLEASLGAARSAALAALPAQYGYPSVAAFIKALKAAAGAREPAPVSRLAPNPHGEKTTRPRITEEIKAAAKTALAAGQTSQTVARELGISFSSVQNLKKSFGLTRSRSRRPAAPAPAPAPAVSAAAAPAPLLPPPPPDLAPAEVPVLVPGAEIEFRHRLATELARTLVKLGDTKLKPFEWRSWREHEKKIRAAAVGHVNLAD
jgi:transposase-like protein